VLQFKKKKQQTNTKTKTMMAYDASEMHCQYCHSSSIFMDHAQGDAICTSCGVVNAEKMLYDGAEWRDYSAVNDEDKKNVARAGCMVDESRWNGGLEPTSLGPVFGGYSGDAERNRKRLNKVKKAVDYWMDRDFEKRVEESRLAIQLKGRRRDHNNGNDGGDQEQDWSDLGTNEHEQIARQRIDQVESSQKMLVSEKWSLDRALLLHGSDDEVPARYTSFNSLAGDTSRDLQQERDILLKRMDISQRKASADLYKSYTLIQAALRRLNFQENVGILAEIMGLICKYANVKGAFTVKGVSTKIPTSPASASASASASRSKRFIEEHRNYNKVRQMGALGAAFVYLICKKNGLGRTLAEICSSLQYDDVDTISTGKQSSLQSQTFIKAKHCSKALSEIRVLMPEYVQSVTIAAGKPTQRTCSGAQSMSGSSSKIAVKSESTSSTNSTGTANNGSSSHTITATTNLVEHSTKNLKLSPVSVAAITNLVVHARQNMQEVKRPAVLIAAIAYLVCDAGATMQRLATQATVVKEEARAKAEPSSPKGDKKRHIRPSGIRNQISSKRRKLDQSNSDSIALVTSTSLDDEKPTSVTPEPEPFDVLSHPIEEMKSLSPLPSWSEWTREKPWKRSIQEIENCCSVTSSAVKECYLKQIYPKRKELLLALQGSFSHNTTINGCHVDVMIGNIAAAAPLMVANPK
jgi:transcription initiation factor TFIIIB Brf1 subunit/transcription initiation factor TFIIB